MPIKPVRNDTRIYLVSDGVNNDRLIRAKSRAAAIRHVASAFTVKAASQDDLVAALETGVVVESANQEESPE